MSQIKEFFEKVKVDNDLMEKLIELGKNEAPDEDVISLASKYGFTITKEDIDNMKNCATKCGKLSEEDLDNVAGGGGTQNRWDANRCMGHGRTMIECVGFLWIAWCDHYTRSIPSDPNYKYAGYHEHKCAMGAFHYYGHANGDPK